MFKSKIHSTEEFMIVKLSGYLDFGAANPVIQTLKQIYTENKQAKVLIDLAELEFVGSAGVSSFVKMMRHFNTRKVKPSYYGVKSEFVRLFRLFEEAEPFDVNADEHTAREAARTRFDRWQARTLRSKSTH